MTIAAAQFLHGVRQLVQRDHQAAHGRIFGDSLRQWRGDPVAVKRVLVGHSRNSGANVDHRAGGLFGLFGLCHYSGTSLKIVGASKFSDTAAK